MKHYSAPALFKLAAALGDVESKTNLEVPPFRAGSRQDNKAIPLKSSGSQVTPASLLQFHEPDDSGFDDLRLRDDRDIFRLSSCHIFASIPTCRKGDCWAIEVPVGRSPGR